MLKLFSRSKANGRATKDGGYSGLGLPPTFESMQPAPVATLDTNPLTRAFQQGRYCAILRDGEWKSQSAYAAVVADVHNELEQRMALVPAGTVSIAKTLAAQAGDPEDDVAVQAYLLDVHCVTNKRFQYFVDAGGYDMLEYWPEEIWPHLIELKDLTGQPGPRYWRQGRHVLADTRAFSFNAASNVRPVPSAPSSRAAAWHSAVPSQGTSPKQKAPDGRKTARGPKETCDQSRPPLCSIPLLPETISPRHLREMTLQLTLHRLPGQLMHEHHPVNLNQNADRLALSAEFPHPQVQKHDFLGNFRPVQALCAHRSPQTSYRSNDSIAPLSLAATDP